MKKTIIFIITLFLITGCSATYNLTLTDSKAIETIEYDIANITLTEKNELDSYLLAPNVFTNYIELKDVFYEKLGNTLSATYDIKNMSYSNLLSSCFDNFQISETNELIAINIKGNFLCLNNMEKVTININSENYVSLNNADSIKNNVYTWVIKESNKENINIEFITNKNTKNLVNKELKGSNLSGYLLILLIIILCFISLLIYRFINKKIDER